MYAQQLIEAEHGIMAEMMLLSDVAELQPMLGAVKAVQARGDVNHIFELDAIRQGLVLYKRHKRRRIAASV